MSIQVVVWFVLALVLAEAIRVRSAHFAEMRRTMAERARARDEQERRQASEERLRIAQELHDVLGHHLSLINVQAGVGLHLMADNPDQARVALEAIKQASTEALGEVRAVLSALRPKDEKAPRAPAPSLAGLDALIAPEHTVIIGEPRPLPPEVERAAYRIVQESLTNVRRHARPGAVATVTIDYGTSALLVRVADDGRGAPASEKSGEGTGIAGMRTRAEALGGIADRRAGSPRLRGDRNVAPGRDRMIKVLLADDQALLRAGFRALLDAQDDIDVVGEAIDGADAVRQAARTRPDVVLMDIRMPGTDGLEATRQIVADTTLQDVRIIILTTFDLDEYVFEALRSGASGFLVKDTEPVELLRAVRAVASGDALLSPGVTRRLIAEFTSRAPATAPPRALDALTDREREVMALVGAGLSNEEIAESLVVSPATAKTHVSRAMGKLGARDRAQLVVYAYESGLVRPSWL